MLYPLACGALAALLSSPFAQGQAMPPIPPLQNLPGPQCDDWNSKFRLSGSQIASAGISENIANNVNVAVNFERTNWATGSVEDDPFYTDVPESSTYLPPGSLLKVEDYTNASLYTFPPNIAISRFMYQTLDWNGSLVPASAFILWPFHPREVPGKGKDTSKNIPLVGWAHGTSGVFSECAPSHIRNLWFQYSAPFTLALQGYAIVAPDYAGLGVSKTFDGKHIPHPWITFDAHGKDLLYAVHAAHDAYKELLSSKYVLFGHSQGGAATWAATTTLQNWTVSKPDGEPPNAVHDFLTSNYLGAVPAAAGGAPFLEPMLFGSPDFLRVNAYGTLLGHAASILTPTPLDEIFTPAGLGRYTLLRALRGANSVLGELFNAATAPAAGFWLRDSFLTPDGVAAKIFRQETAYYARQPRGPLLVLQGTTDQSAPAPSTVALVEQVCKTYGEDLDLDFAVFEGVAHVPVLYAGQRVWLDWIGDRFEEVGGDGGKTKKRCRNKTYKAVREVDKYSQDLQYSLSFVRYPYQIA
ncbi:Alpha/Beta hydrolase protein [Phyllosticta capitalensis]